MGEQLMDTVEQQISILAASTADSLDLDVLDIRLVRLKKRLELRITLDHPENAISIADCSNFSRKLSRLMDLEDPISEPYSIEVSSPGFRRRIRIPRDLVRFTNRRVKMRLTEPVQDRLVWLGLLKNSSDPLCIETDEVGEVEAPFRIIKQLNLHE
jgi:ribosome maturation factor RimP